MRRREVAGTGVVRDGGSARHTEARAGGSDPANLLFAVAVVAVPLAGVILFGAVEPEHALPIQAIALVLGAVAIVSRARRSVPLLPNRGVTCPVLLLAAIPALQLMPAPHIVLAALSPKAAGLGLGVLSVSPYDTGLGLLRWLSYAAYLVAALQVTKRPGGARLLLGALGALGIAEATYGIANLLTGNARLLWLPRESGFATATGTLVNRNHFAAVLEVCLPAFLAWRWLDRRPREHSEERAVTGLVVVLATLVGIAVVLSSSRAGVVCLAAGLGLLLLSPPAGRDGRAGRMAVAALGALIVLYGGFAGGHELATRFREAPTDVGGIRPALWRDAVSLLADFPVLGSGVGTFESIFPGYRRHAVEQLAYAHAHFDYLEVVTDAGVGALLLMLWAGVAFVQTVGTAFRRAGGRRRLVLTAVATGIVSPLLHAMVDFPLHIPGITFLVLAMAAVALGLSQERRAAAD